MGLPGLLVSSGDDRSVCGHFSQTDMSAAWRSAAFLWNRGGPPWIPVTNRAAFAWREGPSAMF